MKTLVSLILALASSTVISSGATPAIQGTPPPLNSKRIDTDAWIFSRLSFLLRNDARHVTARELARALNVRFKQESRVGEPRWKLSYAVAPADPVRSATHTRIPEDDRTFITIKIDVAAIDPESCYGTARIRDRMLSLGAWAVAGPLGHHGPMFIQFRGKDKIVNLSTAGGCIVDISVGIGRGLTR